MVGAGALAPYLIAAHASVRPIADVLIWNRNPERAERWRANLRAAYAVNATADLEGGGARAPMSCPAPRFPASRSCAARG